MDAMISTMENKLDLYNKSHKGAPLKLVFSMNVAGHVLHIIHALSRPKGHAILIGEAGRGRRSCAIVSALLLNYEIFQVFHRFIQNQLFRLIVWFFKGESGQKI